MYTLLGVLWIVMGVVGTPNYVDVGIGLAWMLGGAVWFLGVVLWRRRAERSGVNG